MFNRNVTDSKRELPKTSKLISLLGLSLGLFDLGVKRKRKY